jgi:hypothetical protein
VDDMSTDRIELQHQIVQLPIKNPLSLDEFLNPEDEMIIEEEEDIFEAIVDRYTITKSVEEDESSEEENIKEVDTAEALRAIETVKMWKLQKGDTQDLQVLDRLTRELQRYKISVAHQTTIDRFLEPK